MALKPEGVGAPIASSETLRFTAKPLILDDDPMDDDENEELADLEVELSRHRARTLFHQPRADNDTINSTRSLYDTDLVYTHIHGRTYVGDYFMPTDQDEQTRQQILHSVFLRLLDDKLTTVTLQNPQKILDIGTGTGDWAVAMGEEFPEADIIGTDIARIQPSAVPHNVFFEIDDAEEEGGFTWPDNEFDLVHLRSLSGAFGDWNKIYKETFRILKPGGSIEVIDYGDQGPPDQAGSFRSFFAQDSEVIQLLAAVDEAAVKSGRPRGTKHLTKDMLAHVGFADVTITDKKVPMGVWPDDEEEKKVGKHFLVAQLSGIEALTVRLLTAQGWNIDDLKKVVDDTIEAVRSVALDPKRGRGLGLSIRILTARKPDL